MNDWHNLGDVTYRKVKMYDLKWQEKGIQLEQYQVIGSQLGGPLALVRDEKKFGQAGEKSKILVFSSAGVKISEIELDLTPKIAGVGWNDLEHVIIVREDGTNNELLANEISLLN